MRPPITSEVKVESRLMITPRCFGYGFWTVAIKLRTVLREVELWRYARSIIV